MRAGTPRYAAPTTARAGIRRAAFDAGSRKVATVLVADVKGSMGLIAGHDPETAADFLADVIAALAEIVHREGGTVSESLGDGIVAVFGAPLAVEDHAVRACRAALAMRAAELPSGDRARARDGAAATVELRIGLHSGEVVLRGAGGSPADYLVASGPTTHIAARMEQSAPPGSIRATGDTVRLAGGLIDARSLGLVAVKGLPHPIEAFEITGAKPRTARHEASRGRIPTPFVGRGPELARLREAGLRAGSGAGGAVAVVGEAGSGKSRLLSEFLAEPPFRDWRILQAQALPFTRTGYGTVADLLACLLRLDTVGSGDLAGCIEQGLARLGSDPSLRSPLLALLDPVAPVDAEWGGLGPVERGLRITGAVRALFFDAARQGPLILRVEDVQWLDADSARVLRGLTEDAAPHPMLLLATCRTEAGAASRDSPLPVAQVLRVEPLPRHDCLRLLQALVPGCGQPASMEALVVDRAQGNPFYLEEILSALADRGVLRRLRDGYALVGVPAAMEVPSTIRALLAARIDALAPEGRDVLRAAAVIGRDVPLRLLRHVADLPSKRLRRILDHLVDGGFLAVAPAGLLPGLLTFRHALIQEAAYAETLLRQRRLLHGRVVAAIERLGRRQGGEHVGMLAEHAHCAEAWAKAADYARAAAAQAAARDSNSEAVRFLEQAVHALERLPAADAGSAAVDVRLDLRTPLHRLGRIEELAQRLAEAEPLARVLGDPGREARLRVFQSHAAWLRGDLGQAQAAAALGQALASAAGDAALEALARFHQGMVWLLRGRYDPAIAEMRASVASLPRPAGDARLRRARQDLALDMASYTARAHAEKGEWDAAYVAADAAGRMAARARSPFARIFAGVAAGVVRHLHGRSAEAIPFLDRALGACRDADARLMMPVAAAYLGAAQVAAARPEDGIATLAFALREAEEMGFLALHPLRLAFMAEAQLRCGLPHAALATARTALDLARQFGEEGSEAHALLALGRAEAAAATAADRDASGARPTRPVHLLAALEKAKALSMRPLVHRCADELSAVTALS